MLLLPEHWDLGSDRSAYLGAASELARIAGCHVVAGSQHEHSGSGTYNSGVVVDSAGCVITRYDKQRPYSAERAHVAPGHDIGEFEVAGRRFAILICADFWFSDLFDRLTHAPDVLLVPALSVTRKPSPDYSRALWRHLATSRAYEFATFVGISDWAADSRLPPLRTAGVAGFTDPTGMDPEGFFTPLNSALAVVDLDFDALDAFRQDRRQRGFLWAPRGSNCDAH